jgi:uncharacterized hydrophobic protein (TIGR00271 family)
VGEPRVPPRLGGIIGLLGRWELADLTERDRVRIAAALFHEGHRFGPFVRRFSALMTMSVLIAVMGLLADSTAVVIGAMLVAPLMTPVLGIAAAIVNGWPMRILRSVLTSAMGAGGAVGLAALTSLVFPSSTNPLPGELIARTSPNLLDLGIALAAGAAGAYAQIRRAASDALTGVAVAVALVPPLAVVGVCLQLGLFSYALGALLLFCANVAGIVMAAALTFLICGLVPGSQLGLGDRRVVGGLRWAAVAVIIMVLPLHFTRSSVLPPVDPTDEVRQLVDEFVDQASWNAAVVDLNVGDVDSTLVVEMVVTESAIMPNAAGIADHLAVELETDVSVTMQVVQVTTESARSSEDSQG